MKGERKYTDRQRVKVLCPHCNKMTTVGYEDIKHRFSHARTGDVMYAGTSFDMADICEHCNKWLTIRVRAKVSCDVRDM